MGQVLMLIKYHKPAEKWPRQLQQIRVTNDYPLIEASSQATGFTYMCSGPPVGRVQTNAARFPIVDRILLCLRWRLLMASGSGTLQSRAGPPILLPARECSMEYRHLSPSDVRKIASLPVDRIRETVISVLNASEPHSLNADAFVLLGINLSNHRQLDLAVVEWADTVPSEDRLDMVCVLLTGLWQRGRITVGALDRLISLHDAIKPGEAVEYWYLLALSEAAQGETRDRVREILDQARESQIMSNAALDRILKERITRAVF